LKPIPTAFFADIAGIAHSVDTATLDVKSKDYYWYSPVLAAQLDGKCAQVFVQPSDRAEITRVAAACAKHRVPVTLRGGGTGNYGQAVPLAGGVVLDTTCLSRVLSVADGMVRVEAGCLIMDLERAVRAQGYEINMFPSTRDIATIGGFIAGGYAGAGSVRNGILKDPGNVTWIEVLLHGADIQKVHHAYGTNGIILTLELGLNPAVDWVHHIALFDGYGSDHSGYLQALKFGCDATEALHARPTSGIDAFLITAVERRIAPYYAAELGERFPSAADAVFSMVHPDSLEAWRALMRAHGGRESLAMTEVELQAAKLPPAFECAYNHTTLMALRQDRSWTNLQTVAPWTTGSGIDLALVQSQMQRYGDEVLQHHEFGFQYGQCVAFGLPLVSYFDRDRLYEIMADYERDGCMVFDNHVYTIEDGGMKEIDHAQIDFKKIADPHGLMNPGKTRGWLPEYAKP
jgi:FAD binding domain